MSGTTPCPGASPLSRAFRSAHSWEGVLPEASAPKFLLAPPMALLSLIGLVGMGATVPPRDVTDGPNLRTPPPKGFGGGNWTGVYPEVPTYVSRSGSEGLCCRGFGGPDGGGFSGSLAGG